MKMFKVRIDVSEFGGTESDFYCSIMADSLTEVVERFKDSGFKVSSISDECWLQTPEDAIVRLRTIFQPRKAATE